VNRWLIVAFVGALFLPACEDEITTQGSPRASASQVAASASAAVAEAPKIDFQEAEFVESDRSRDPFRSFADKVAAEARDKMKSQREVVLSDYSVDELKLIGIVTRIEPAKAMLVDPTGVGHVIQRGQFVGRSEIVQAGGPNGATYEINWRVDRIREDNVVLVREDPTNPDVPSTTRVIPLRPEGSLVADQH
jgi:type IV pilus assembly protein PilP